MVFVLQILTALIVGALLESDEAAAEEHSELRRSSLSALKTQDNARPHFSKPESPLDITESIPDEDFSSRAASAPFQPTAFTHETNGGETRDLGRKNIFRNVAEPVQLVPIYSSLLGDKYVSPFESPIPVPLPFAGIVVPDIAHLTPKGTRPASVYPRSKSGPLLNERRLQLQGRLKRKDTWENDIPRTGQKQYTSKYYNFEAGDYRPDSWMSHSRRLSESDSLTSPEIIVSSRIMIKDRYTANINPWAVRARAQSPMVFYYPQTATHAVDELPNGQGIERISASDLPAIPPPPPCVGVGCYRRLDLKNKPRLFASRAPVVVVEVIEEKKKIPKEPKEDKVKVSAPPEIRYIPLSKEYIPLLAWPVTHPHPGGSKHNAHGPGGVSFHGPQMMGHGDHTYPEHDTWSGGGHDQESHNASYAAETGTPTSGLDGFPPTTENAQPSGGSRLHSEAPTHSSFDQGAYAVPDGMGSSMILPYTAAGDATF
ncbi:hypothetical protein TGMAS_228430 [Toxoplasma gondii MAS]|uniref:Transmembrane protein n=1 Tax=Toxoplasma gondii MAS TaxID=943118 RepID=A0A086QBQ7_TOXGO|nr:hypothetical protein TGMAS_228430 [Toxoplasma gondii MAS]